MRQHFTSGEDRARAGIREAGGRARLVLGGASAASRGGASAAAARESTGSVLEGGSTLGE